MKHSSVARAGLLASLMACAGCGQDALSPPVAPTGPTSLSAYLMPQVAGLWAGPLTLQTVGSGTGVLRSAGSFECAGVAISAQMFTANDSSLLISQDGTQLTARLTSAETGLACDYKGAVSAQGAIVLDAAASSCVAQPLILRCLPNDDGSVDVRQLELVGSSLTATFGGQSSASTLAGVASHTYNVFDQNHQPVGGIVASQSFTLTRR